MLAQAQWRLSCIHLRWWVLYHVTVVGRSGSDEDVLPFTVIIVTEFTGVKGASSCYPRVVRGRLSGRDIVLVDGGMTAHCQKANSAFLREEQLY